jgi:metallo-beta-lactamase family protein
MESEKKLFGSVSFHGATGDVTGANFLVEINGKRLLVDCGLHQGEQADQNPDSNFGSFPYDPATIDILFVTHPHTDHIGKIPKLVRDGFRGVIYSTPPTRDISRLMFDDALGLMEDEAKRKGIDPMYDKSDIETAMQLWKVVSYHNHLDIGNDVSVEFYDAGHVLGSAMVEFSYGGKKLLCTGDLGNTPTTLLRDTEVFMEPNFLLMESVYGDRNHPGEDRTAHLERVIDNVIQKKGTMLIPSFSLERTQEVLYELNNLIEDGHVSRIPVYLDSPLAIGITEIYRGAKDYFNKTAKADIVGGDDIFQFPGLQVTTTSDESKAIFHAPDPKIIIAGSGMMNGGRIVHHARHYLPDSRTTLLLVGYQAMGTLGRVIQSGAKTVRIFGEEIPVYATVDTISGFSGHKGSDQLVDFVKSIHKKLEHVFVVMGETSSSQFLATRLCDQVAVNATTPKEGEKIDLYL